MKLGPVSTLKKKTYPYILFWFMMFLLFDCYLIDPCRWYEAEKHQPVEQSKCDMLVINYQNVPLSFHATQGLFTGYFYHTYLTQKETGLDLFLKSCDNLAA